MSDDARLEHSGPLLLAEMATFDHGWGRDCAAGVGEADVIEREAMRRVGHGIHPELDKTAVGSDLLQAAKQK